LDWGLKLNPDMHILAFLNFFSSFIFVLAIWPRLHNLTTGNTPLRLANGFSIQLSGISQVPYDLSDAIQRTSHFLKADKLQALVPDRGASSSGAVKSAAILQSLLVKLSQHSGPVKSISEDTVAGLGASDESYTLRVPADSGTAILTANTAIGLFRGLTTFGQLWYNLDGSTYTLIAPIHVSDSPAYVSLSGVFLDPTNADIPSLIEDSCSIPPEISEYYICPSDQGRTYTQVLLSFPVEDIKRTLDAMSWVKINHFHWHVVDAQSFPLVVPCFEKISQRGAYSSGQIYTPQNVQDVVAYAAAVHSEMIYIHLRLF